MKNLVYKSLLLSIIIQAIICIIEILFLFIKVSPDIMFLKQLMVLEVIVQFIEGSFYVYWLYHFKKILDITPKRYSDWAITTPTMLVTLIFYLIFLRDKQQNFFELFIKEFNTIIVVLLLNWAMLLFGYLGEIKVIPVLVGVLLGFIPFLIYYYIIYKKYVLTNDGIPIFLYFFIVWSLYGVAAIMPYKIKNIFYNTLDLFSKNFLGLFLGYLIYKSSISG